MPEDALTVSLTSRIVADVLGWPGTPRITEHVDALLTGRTEWLVSEPLGSMRATRLVSNGERQFAIKLISTPPAIMQRLSDLAIIPQIAGLGEIAGHSYLVQNADDERHPDHAWFLEHRRQWATMINRYLNDPPLTDLVTAQPPFWRHDVDSALAMINNDLDRGPGHSAALHTPAFLDALDRWRSDSRTIPRWSMRPIHPDAHWHNYVIDDNDRPFLLDWDLIDLSDPMRDIGSQLWGFLPRRCWPEMMQWLHLPLYDGYQDAIYWWAACKLLGNALFNDSRGDESGVTFHLELFCRAAARTPHLDDPR